MVSLPESRITSYGRTRALEFASDPTPPAATEVVVIGGGINGVVVAWLLARRGVPVLLCEKADIGCESSGRAFGWISELLLDPVKMALSSASKTGWAELQRDVGETGYRVDGLCYLAETSEEMDFYGDWLRSVEGIGSPDSRLLDAEGVAARLPGLRRRWAGGILAPSDGCAEPQLAAPVVAAAARSAGANIMTGCAVRGLDIAAGKVAGVVTERGAVRATAVVFAGNAWSRLFCGNHGIDVPQLYVILSQARVGPIANGPIGCGGQSEWAWRRQIDGGYSLGGLRGQRLPLTRDCIQLFSRFLPILKTERAFIRPSLDRDARRDWGWRRRWTMAETAPFERHRILDPQANHASRAVALGRIREELDGFDNAPLAEVWAGAITVTPDNLPIASMVDAIPGLFLITGCSYGLTWAPALGRLVADQITGQTPALDPRQFQLCRFFDGRPLRVTH